MDYSKKTLTELVNKDLTHRSIVMASVSPFAQNDILEWLKSYKTRGQQILSKVYFKGNSVITGNYSIFTVPNIYDGSDLNPES